VYVNFLPVFLAAVFAFFTLAYTRFPTLGIVISYSYQWTSSSERTFITFP
jgi:hypothetical protein